MNELEGEERTRYAFATAYHTSLVMGLLCAVSLREGRTPPARLAGPDFERELVDRLFTFVDADQGHWQPVFAALPEPERLTLAPLLLDLALLQKLRKRDYDSVNTLLQLAATNDLELSPLAIQATEQLERLVAFSATVDLHA